MRLDETLKPENRRSLHPKKLWQTMLQVLLNPIATGYALVSGLVMGASVVGSSATLVSVPRHVGGYVFLSSSLHYIIWINEECQLSCHRGGLSIKSGMYKYLLGTSSDLDKVR